MTDSSGYQDEDYLVEVKAQVMTRDDSKGGWVPMERGGMSRVGLRRHMLTPPPPTPPPPPPPLHVTNTAASGHMSTEDLRHEYHIHGTRIADQTEVLNCMLKKDIQYTKANPTFHHWRIDQSRFGLTFQSSADASAFDKGVRRAVDDLLEGSHGRRIPHQAGDEDVFMALNLPLGGRKGSYSVSASTVSTTTSSPPPHSPVCPTQSPTCSPPPLSPTTPPHTPTPLPHSPTPPRPTSLPHPSPPPLPPHNHQPDHLHRVHYITRRDLSAVPPPGSVSPLSSPPKSTTRPPSPPVISGTEVWVKPERNGVNSEKCKVDGDSSTTEETIEMLDYAYVQFTTPQGSTTHEYNYPTSEEHSGSKTPSQTSTPRRDSVSSVKKHNLESLALPTKSKRKERLKEKKVSRHLLSQRSRCVYCHEMFVHDENHRGSCEDAPDKMAVCIERASCICCARCVLYHCMADADGDYGHPCVCDMSDENNCRKWTALSVLAVLVPCLWCFVPLSACHRCGVACGCCGGRHKDA